MTTNEYSENMKALRGKEVFLLGFDFDAKINGSNLENMEPLWRMGHGKIEM